MKNFERKMAVVSFLSMGILLASSFLYADMDTASEAYPTSSGEEQSDSLGQFPRTESAPMAMSTSSREAVAAGVSSEGTAFPKVQTSQDEEMAKRFSWWPTDAKPAPFKDPDRSGYWWWPEIPGEARPWGNQGYVYVRKVIFDYKSSTGEMKPSLVIKKVLKNVKVYFDYDKSDLRDDAIDALSKAVFTLERNPSADILITGNADTRGSEQYNLKLGEKRAASVEQYIRDRGISSERIRILSRGKLDALAPTDDLVGMQKDRNAQFMVAEVEEVMIPADQASLFEDKKVVEEQQNLEGEIRVSTKDYVIQKGDTLWAIAEREYGNGRQWKRIYEFNKDVIADPNKPKRGTKISIPIE